MISFAFDHRPPGSAFRLNMKGHLPLGKTTAIFGPSGAGKSTLLRLLAGLERPHSGYLTVGNETWLDAHRQMPVQRRRIGMVFQDFALFPHLSVHDNVAFSAGRQSLALVEELLALTELTPFSRQRPGTLSGGQRQRVALARALASRPRLLLLDEPLSALEQALRHTLRQMLRDMQARFGFTMILVSHDLTEVFSLADHVLTLTDGRITATGTPAELFLTENSKHAQLHATVLAIRPADAGWRVSVQLGQKIVNVSADTEQVQHLTPGCQVVLSAGTLHLNQSNSNGESLE